MKIKPEVKLLEKVENLQILILKILIPKVNPTKSELKAIKEALKEREVVEEEELFKILRE